MTANGASRVAEPNASPSPVKRELGVEALGDHTLKVRLQRPDKNFPALVAHPVFRPVYQPERAETAEQGEAVELFAEDHAKDSGRQQQASPVISNGAFNLSAQAADGVVDPAAVWCVPGGGRDRRLVERGRRRGTQHLEDAPRRFAEL